MSAIQKALEALEIALNRTGVFNPPELDCMTEAIQALQSLHNPENGDCCCGETEEAWRLCPTHGPKENVFSDNGADIEKRMEEHADISCPACGGSGHKDDFKPVQSLGVDSRLIHVGYTNPHQIEHAKVESGLFYPDTEHDCWIPVYMLKTHEHRLFYPVDSGVRGTKTEPVESRNTQQIEVTDEMAMAFHHAETDGAIGNSELDEIKVGLRAALANVCATQSPAVPDGMVTEAESLNAQKKAFWAGFEICASNVHGRNILPAWLDYKAIAASKEQDNSALAAAQQGGARD